MESQSDWQARIEKEEEIRARARVRAEADERRKIEDEKTAARRAEVRRRLQQGKRVAVGAGKGALFVAICIGVVLLLAAVLLGGMLKSR